MKFHEKLWDRMNPIFIKELRQSLHGKGFYFRICAFLVIAFFVYLLSSPGAHVQFSGRIAGGVNLFNPLIVIVAFMVFGVIPLGVSSRFSADAEEDSMNLIYTTTIKPSKIIFGKFWAGFVNTLVITSLAFPFFALSYFLGGVDLMSVVNAYILLIAISMPFLAFSILNSVLPGRKSLKRLRLIILFLFLIIPISSFTYEVMRQLSRSGIGLTQTTEIIGIFAIIIIFLTLITGVFLFSSVAHVAPESSNRSYPLRVFLGIGSLIVVAMSIIINYFVDPGNYDGAAYMSGTILAVVFIYSLASFINEPCTISSRIKNELPKNPVMAFFHYPFTYGGISGLWFSVIIGVMSFVFPFLIVRILGSTRFNLNWDSEPMEVLRGTFFHIIFLATLSYFLYHKCFKRVFPQLKPLVLTVVFLMLSIMGNILVYNLLGTGRESFGFSIMGLYEFGTSARRLSCTIGSILGGISLVALVLQSPLELNKFKKN